MKRCLTIKYLLILLPLYGISQDQTVNGNFNLGLDGGLQSGKGSVLTFQGVQSNTDVLSIYRFNRSFNSSDLRISIGDDLGSPADRFAVGVTSWLNGEFNPFFIFHADGKLTIGTEEIRDERLAVNGKIRAHEIKVETVNWPDYVFAKDYKLPTLQETEKHIKERGHLPGIPSATEVKANGIALGEMNAKLLQKIEELTLYTIEQQKRILQQEKQSAELKAFVLELAERLNKTESLK